MTIRPTQTTSYDLVRAGLARNMAKLLALQGQVASGKRIQKPSDDPTGAAGVLALRGRLGEVGRWLTGAAQGAPLMQAASSAVGEAGEILARARELAMSGLNGTLSDQDRASLAAEVELLRDRLLEVGNTEDGGSALFGGAGSAGAPFSVVTSGGVERVVYRGSSEARAVPIGEGSVVPAVLPGDDVFASSDPAGAQYVGVTGAKRGSSADEGSGYLYLHVRHDATTATLGGGIALAGGGAADTLLGSRALVVDPAAGTATLGGGEPVAIPAGAAASDVVVRDEHGAEVHLDFSAWDGSAVTGTVAGSGSISIDGTTWTALDLSSGDVELSDATTGTIVHVDATGIVRAGTDLVTFTGTVNAFDVLQGLIDDLRDVHGLDDAELQDRLSARLPELDRNHDRLQLTQAVLGGRLAEVADVEERLEALDVDLRERISKLEDVDLADAVLELTRAEQTLQLAQATGARLLRTTLLDYLG